jgi:acylpyruvate hydrolase
MRLARFVLDGRQGIAALDGDTACGRFADEAAYPGELDALLAEGPDILRAAGEALYAGTRIDLSMAQLLSPFCAPGKIICVGLNYADHSDESGFAVPEFPTIFARFASSLIGPGAAIVRPRASEQLDYEGELVAVIGKGGRYITKACALEHVVGYTLFNDASVRDFQLRTPQWTVGKNFDGTGAIGPVFVTADALPPGCAGLRLTTRLNGQVVQDAGIDDMIFGVADLVSRLSETMTLAPGDIIVTGTPSGVGMARRPPLWMHAGDVCEVEIPGIGILRNPVIDEDA